MINISDTNISRETIRKVGLRLSHAAINAEITPNARVFEYPNLKDVFVMENDLYGNIMPNGSCFLAFYGQHGLIGTELSVEKLSNSSVEDIRNIVQVNTES
jgi:hypothetical protein